MAVLQFQSPTHLEPTFWFVAVIAETALLTSLIMVSEALEDHEVTSEAIDEIPLAIVYTSFTLLPMAEIASSTVLVTVLETVLATDVAVLETAFAILEKIDFSAPT